VTPFSAFKLAPANWPVQASSPIGGPAFELQFEPGFFEAYERIYSPSTKEELDGLCSEARRRRQVKSLNKSK
jgi:hypothetical protein